jgi:four helix bundle protein
MWQKGIEIVKDTYKYSKNIPKDESFGLISQMKRSAISILSNIAEGFKRFHNKEFRQFLHIALGSTAELETQAIIAKELGFLSQEILNDFSEKLDHLGKMISAYLKTLR